MVVDTNDTGPWGLDVWWLLFGPDDKVACVFPQGASGEAAALDVLMALDHQRMVDAMRSTDVATFPLWRRMD